MAWEAGNARQGGDGDVIINESATGKRIDAKTGVYLTGADSDTFGVYSLALYDGETRISFSAIRDWKKIADRKHVLTYHLKNSPLLSQPPRRKNYKEIIEALLTASYETEIYGAGVYEEIKTVVAFTPEFLVPLAAWEASHV